MRNRNVRLSDNWKDWFGEAFPIRSDRIQRLSDRFGVDARTARRWYTTDSAPSAVADAIAREQEGRVSPHEQLLEAASLAEQLSRFAGDVDHQQQRERWKLINAALRSAILANGRRLRLNFSKPDSAALKKAVDDGGFIGADGMPTTTPSTHGAPAGGSYVDLSPHLKLFEVRPDRLRTPGE